MDIDIVDTKSLCVNCSWFVAKIELIDMYEGGLEIELLLVKV